MSTAIILDTETTSIDAPDVIELAYTAQLVSPFDIDVRVRQLQFKPTKPIQLGAMATHHIIEEDLVDCPTWPGSWSFPEELSGVEYIIGHNVDFDWRAIGEPNVKRICTLALSRKAFPGIDSHSLVAMIYHLYPHAMAREFVKSAHSAAADVDLCYRVLGAVSDASGRPDTWEKLWAISEKARVPTVFTFGKHKGLPIAEVKKIDRGYISWCLSGKCEIVNDDPYWQKALTA